MRTFVKYICLIHFTKNTLYSTGTLCGDTIWRMDSPHRGKVMRIGLPWDLIIMYDVVSVCAAVVIVYLKPIPCSWICRDHFVYVPSQWETTLHCNVVSHWLGAYTERSLMCTSMWLCLHGVHRYLYILLHHYFVIWTPGICTLNKQHPYPCMSTPSDQFPSSLWSAAVLSVDSYMLVAVSHWKLTTDIYLMVLSRTRVASEIWADYKCAYNIFANEIRQILGFYSDSVLNHQYGELDRGRKFHIWSSFTGEWPMGMYRY